MAGSIGRARRFVVLFRTLPVTIAGVAGQLPGRRVVLTSLALVALVVVAVVLPVPNAVQMRDWAAAAGPWLPLAFLAAHALATVVPVPRTAFTLAAGLLFGPALGIAVAVTASTISAVLALLLVRAFGWKISGPRVDGINDHLSRRGWPAVLSLRLIPAVPFSVINYAAGVSSVRLLPYTLATVVGLLPGTSSVVILGDALTGTVNPLLIVVSVCTAGVGFAGLAYEAWVHRRHVRDREAPRPVP